MDVNTLTRRMQCRRKLHEYKAVSADQFPTQNAIRRSAMSTCGYWMFPVFEDARVSSHPSHDIWMSRIYCSLQHSNEHVRPKCLLRCL